MAESSALAFQPSQLTGEKDSELSIGSLDDTQTRYLWPALPDQLNGVRWATIIAI